MPTVNEQIADLSIRHQVGVQRLASGITNRLMTLLDAAEQDILEQLAARQATLEGSFTSQRLGHLLNAIREINADLHSQFAADLRGELRNFASYEAAFQTRLVQQFVPAAMDIVSPTASVLDAVITSRPFQGRVLRDWVKDLSAGTMKRLQQAIQLGMVEGETVEQIIRRVRGTLALGYRDGVMETTRRHAGNLVRTATNHIANAAREKHFEANKDIVKKVQWSATLDTRTCPVCMKRDGKTWVMGSGPRPPAHPSCRCAIIPVLKSWRELGIDADDIPPGTRASMDGQVPESLNFDQWLRRQNAERQDEALGPTRGALFRRGGLDVDAFSDSRGHTYTLDELRRREARAFAQAGIE